MKMIMLPAAIALMATMGNAQGYLNGRSLPANGPAPISWGSNGPAPVAPIAPSSSSISCPGNSCNTPPHNNNPSTPSTPVVRWDERGNLSVINRQTNRSPVVSAITGVIIRSTAGRRGVSRVSGNTISATAVGNSSVIRVRRSR